LPRVWGDRSNPHERELAMTDVTYLPERRETFLRLSRDAEAAAIAASQRGDLEGSFYARGLRDAYATCAAFIRPESSIPGAVWVSQPCEMCGAALVLSDMVPHGPGFRHAVDCRPATVQLSAAARICPDCGRSTARSEEWSTGQCDDCHASDAANVATSPR
jgi:hypothetical protein